MGRSKEEYSVRRDKNCVQMDDLCRRPTCGVGERLFHQKSTKAMTNKDNGPVVTAFYASIGLQRSHKSMGVFLDRVGTAGPVEGGWRGIVPEC